MAKRLISTSFSLVPTFPTRRTVFWMSPSPRYSKLMIRPVCLSTTKIGKHTGVSTENIWQKVFLNYGESLFFVVFFFYIYWIVNFLIDSFIVRSCQLKRNMFAEVHYPISIYLIKCNYINLVKPWRRKQLLPLLSLFSNKYKKNNMNEVETWRKNFFHTKFFWWHWTDQQQHGICILNRMTNYLPFAHLLTAAYSG